MKQINRQLKRLLLLSAVVISLPAQAAISEVPLFLTQAVDPRVMLVMSNDHQLSIKAYTDYSDLNDDGTLDTTYSDSIDYNGYFDSNKCYEYSSSNDRFAPKEAVDSGTHQCSANNNRWSGNFLNWATMTRMDMVRWVLYGGYRSTDTTSTYLERAFLPWDVHAFAKTFTSADMQKYTAYSDATISLCNFTDDDSSNPLSKNNTSPPLLRVASGSFPRWAAQEVTQCQWGTGGRPVEADDKLAELEVRVEVCVSGLEESNCKTYGSNSKPTGLLQEYGEDTLSRPIQFGLITGSYEKNKSGGVLRRNLERITGHTGSDASRNEIDTSDGTFINQGSTDDGIINTLNRLRISSYDYDTNKYETPCNTAGLSSLGDGSGCADWGNPLSEIYLETLRYLSGESTATTAFNADDSGHIDDLPQVSWRDPMPSDEYCADTSVLTLTTGLNSFDTDQLTGHGLTGLNVTTVTNTVGTLEGGLPGKYMLGTGSVTDDKQCTAKVLNNLADAEGVCPEVPSMEGGYHIAGMAYHARTADLRSDRTDDQLLTTYGVALAESLPSFSVTAGSNTVTLLPACLANGTGSAAIADSGWRYCSMTDLIVEFSSAIEGKFLINWEDSTWGNDYDMDGIARLEYCIGKTCANTGISNDNSVGDAQLRVRVEAVQANAGHALAFGYTLAGSTDDGLKIKVLRPGGANFPEDGFPKHLRDLYPDYTNSLHSDYDDIRRDFATLYTDVEAFTAGASSAGVLKNPLWYAAKYGGFNSGDDTDGPNLASEWDEDGDGTPDTFFQVANPGELVKSLGEVLADVASRDASASAVTTSSTRLNTSTVAFQALFSSADWSGQLNAIPVNADGSVGSIVWDAADNIPAHGSRNVYFWDPATSAGMAFSTANNTEINAVPATTLTDDQINYLRGDGSKEQSETGGTLRNRASLTGHSPMGDVVNSDPLFISKQNFGYSKLDDPDGSAYAVFRAASSYTARPSMLYVGGNDGMLHAFEFSYDAVAKTATGTELFSFIPNAVFGNLSELSDPNYSHNYYVDGSPTFGDAYIDHNGDSSNSWRTVLLGTTGAGGSGVFALDVTDPSNFTAANILWDVDSSHTDFADLGYTLGEATMARLPDGKFYAIFGNGYNSASGKAVIYLVPLDDPASVVVFDTQTTGNGMSSPIAIDTDGDKTADAIYAGDLLGNVWKLELGLQGGNLDVDPAFKQGTTPKPFFTASHTSAGDQPITAKIEVGRHEDGGQMLYFGTGKYYESGDNTVGATPDIQSFYGIREDGSQVSRSDLVAQTIDVEDTTSFTDFNVRVTSDNAVNYSLKEGWYMDLKLAAASAGLGERVINKPILRDDRVFFTSIVPSNDACSLGGESWLMELNASSGARPDGYPFDLNKDGVYDSGDYVTLADGTKVQASGIQFKKMGITDNPAFVEDGEKVVIVAGGSGSGTGEGEQLETTNQGKSGEEGRQSWQQFQ